MSHRAFVALFAAALSSGGCDPGLRVGEVRSRLEIAVTSNMIEAVPVGCHTKGRAEVQVTNRGAEPSVLLSPLFSAGLSAALPAGLPVNTCVSGTALGSLQACSIFVQGSPVAEGPRTEFVVVEGAPGDEARSELPMTGLPNLSADRSSVSTEIDLMAGASPVVSTLIVVTVGATPTAYAPRLVGPNAAQFSLSSLPSQNDPAEACTPRNLTVSFDAPGVGTYTASLVLGSTDGGAGNDIPLMVVVR